MNEINKPRIYQHFLTFFGELAKICSASWPKFVRRVGTFLFGELAVFCSASWPFFVRRVGTQKKDSNESPNVYNLLKLLFFYMFQQIIANFSAIFC